MDVLCGPKALWIKTPNLWQIIDVGEVVLEVGAPSGWGPVGMTEERLDLCLRRAKEVARGHGSGVVLLRPIRQVEVQTVLGPGELSQSGQDRIDNSQRGAAPHARV